MGDQTHTCYEAQEFHLKKPIVFMKVTMSSPLHVHLICRHFSLAEHFHEHFHPLSLHDKQEITNRREEMNCADWIHKD